MPVITRELLRKRAEHNEGMISTLEEISLHQEELEGINPVLGMTCRKIKILYLQNNIIPRMENLFHLKDLVYLNLALNNITKIEGLSNCEFLSKLDLTVNFIDFDTLKESIDHLRSRTNLKELFMMGNPSEHVWEQQFVLYVIATLPQLHSLDGTEITKSMQIQAKQKLPLLEKELGIHSEKIRKDKSLKAISTETNTTTNSEVLLHPSGVIVEDVEDNENDIKIEGGQELTDNTPETRVKIYQELAQQKKEKEDRERVNAPRQRDSEKEHQESIKNIRDKESNTLDVNEIKQKNEGGWEFYWDEETTPGVVILEVRIAKHLDSSLIDVDVHPTYVSIVIKSKVLRLRLPAEVKVSESKCQRAKVNGYLMVIMPKINPKESAITIKTNNATNNSRFKDNKSYNNTTIKKLNTNTSSNTIIKPKKLSLQEQMLLEASQQQQQQQALLNNNNNNNNTTNDSLLDSKIGISNNNNINVTNIIKKNNIDSSSTSNNNIDKESNDNIFKFSNKVIELD